MADLAATWSAQRADLADRVRRKVVMQQETLELAVAVDAVLALAIFGRTERAAHDRLGLAAREHRRAVGAR